MSENSQIVKDKGGRGVAKWFWSKIYRSSRSGVVHGRKWPCERGNQAGADIVRSPDSEQPSNESTKVDSPEPRSGRTSALGNVGRAFLVDPFVAVRREWLGHQVLLVLTVFIIFGFFSDRTSITSREKKKRIIWIWQTRKNLARWKLSCTEENTMR